MGAMLKAIFDRVKKEKGAYHETQLAIFLGISASRVEQTPESPALIVKAQKMVEDVFKIDL